MASLGWNIVTYLRSGARVDVQFKLGAINDAGKKLVIDDLDTDYWQATVEQVAEEDGWTGHHT
jgi:hypothetical protein